MLDKKLLIGIVLLFGGFYIMLQKQVAGALFGGLAVMIAGLYLVLDNIK